MVNEGTDGKFCDIQLFNCPPKFGVLWEVSEFEKSETDKINFKIDSVANWKFLFDFPFIKIFSS